MKDGYIRIAAASFDTNIADIKNNSLQICKLIEQAYENKAKIIVFPELCLTGYTCEDLFNQDRLLNEAKFQLQNIIEKTINKDIIVVVGLPYQHLNSLYNVAAIIHSGKLLGLVPKTHVPNYQEFYEDVLKKHHQKIQPYFLMVKLLHLVLNIFLLHQLIVNLNLELKFVRISGCLMLQVLILP